MVLIIPRNLNNGQIKNFPSEKSNIPLKDIRIKSLEAELNLKKYSAKAKIKIRQIAKAKFITEPLNSSFR